MILSKNTHKKRLSGFRFRPDIVLLLVRRLAHPPADDAEHVLDRHHALEGKLVYSLARVRLAQLPAEKSLGSSVSLGMIQAQLVLHRFGNDLEKVGGRFNRIIWKSA